MSASTERVTEYSLSRTYSHIGKFSSPTWTPDGEGFYYGRYPAPKEGEKYEAQTKAQKIDYHELGTPRSEDRLVYERPDNPKLGFGMTVTHDGRYLVQSQAIPFAMESS